MKHAFNDYDPAIAVEIVKRFEGLRLDAYLCPAGIWTIGYGHTGGVQGGERITEERAEELLMEDLKSVQRRLAPAVEVPVTAGQAAALMSLAFNVGVGAVTGSKLLRRLNQGLPEAAADEFLDWTRAGGQELPGLVRRRRAERDLFLREGL